MDGPFALEGLGVGGRGRMVADVGHAHSHITSHFANYDDKGRMNIDSMVEGNCIMPWRGLTPSFFSFFRFRRDNLGAWALG
jgi:hypothetical protein